MAIYKNFIIFVAELWNSSSRAAVLPADNLYIVYNFFNLFIY